MTDVVKLKSANARRWAAAKMTRGPEFGPVARRLVANKARFQAMEARTGVPWYVIAVIKERESGPDPQWLKSIAQGEPWNRRSRLVPAGRGPFKSWEEAAYDALVNCPPYAAKNKDWSIGGALTLLESYNGFGYAARGLPSPYIWSGTDQYKSGKFVADHVFDPNKVDSQLGCAGVLLAMQAIDSSIKLGAALVMPTTVTPIASTEVKPVATPAAKAAGTGGAVVVAGAGAAAAQAGLSAPEILAIIVGVSLAFGGAILIGYRLMKGYWPWTSTGKASQEPSLLSPQSSAPSSEQVSAALLEVSSVASPATPLRKSSASRRPRRQSARPSRKTRTRPKKSSSSKPTAARKSAAKRKSKSKS